MATLYKEPVGSFAQDDDMEVSPSRRSPKTSPLHPYGGFLSSPHIEDFSETMHDLFSPPIAETMPPLEKPAANSNGNLIQFTFSPSPQARRGPQKSPVVTDGAFFDTVEKRPRVYHAEVGSVMSKYDDINRRMGFPLSPPLPFPTDTLDSVVEQRAIPSSAVKRPVPADAKENAVAVVTIDTRAKENKSNKTPSISGTAPPVKPKAAPRKPTGKRERQKRQACNCKNSKCLKLYCECFAAKIYCEDCNCNDCANTPSNAEARDKAIQAVLAKNPKAFDAIVQCKCSQSKCLKKYCECFANKEFCTDSCKCKNCENYPGSQKLIDRRLKMKDKEGAEIATRAAQEVWKKSPTPTKKPTPQSISGPATMPPTHYMAPGYMPPYYYMGPGMSAAGLYSPMMSYDTAMRGYAGQVVPFPYGSGSKRPAPPKISSTPRTPAVRAIFDLISSRKKRRKQNGEEETLAVFGNKVALQPKTACLAIFSYLSAEDTFRASLVSKEWRKLAMDEELWTFA